MYFGKQPKCPCCDEVTPYEYLQRSRYTGKILCDTCIPFDPYSNEWNYYAEGHDAVAGYPVDNEEENNV